MNAIATVAAVTRPSEVVNLEVFAELLSNSLILEKTDIGSALIYKVRHPISGDMVLINTAGDKNMVAYI